MHSSNDSGPGTDRPLIRVQTKGRARWLSWRLRRDGKAFETVFVMKELIRALLLIVLIAVVGMFVFGFWAGNGWRSRPDATPAPTGTTGTIDTQKARERGAELGEKAAVATAKVQETLSDAQVTTKIKAKMTLDDLVKARAIDVTTNGTTVTLRGTVGSREEHDRAIALARETVGVSKVVDELLISR
jgi:hyperosmotically inducible protein